MGNKKSPGPLVNHLSKIHKICVKRGCEGDMETVKPGKRTVQSMVSQLTAEDGLSFKIIAKSTTLRELFSVYGYDLPTSPNTVREFVLKQAFSVEQEFKVILKAAKNEGRRFNLTMDEWTSTRGRRYANLNVHLEEQVFCLGLRWCEGSMPTDKCIEMVMGTLKEFDLCEEDISGITTDGARVMVKMGKLLPFIHQQCISHGLHLAVTDVLYKKNLPMNLIVDVDDNDNDNGLLDSEDGLDGDGFLLQMGLESDAEDQEITEFYGLKQLIEKVRKVLQVTLSISQLHYFLFIFKVRKIVCTFKGHPVRMSFLNKHVAEDHGKIIGLLADCLTRWNSTHDMIEP